MSQFFCNGKIVFLLLICFFLCVVSHKKYLPLPPVFATNVQLLGVSEPSGVGYCSSTGHLYLICDECQYIYEVDLTGKPIQRLAISGHTDIEDVACYDDQQLLYIVEEELRRVTAYHMKSSKLEYAYNFTVTIENPSRRSGLEAITINSKTSEIYLGNEKYPAAILRCEFSGQQVETTILDFSDISAIAYDDVLDILWLVSDQDEQLYATDVTGSVIYDHWDLPLTDPEGVTVNNDVDPAMIYVVTDPGANDAEYVPALFGFIKPEIGSGYKNYGSDNLPDYVTNPPVCHGCYSVYHQAVKHSVSDAVYWENHFPRGTSQEIDQLVFWIQVGGIGAFLVLLCFALVVFVIAFIRLRGLHALRNNSSGIEILLEEFNTEPNSIDQE